MRSLSSDDVDELVDIDDVVASVEKAYQQLGNGTATDFPRENLRADDIEGSLKAMPAVSPSGLGGYVYTGGFSNQPEDAVSKLGFVFDDATGGLLGIIELDRLSWLRTGATSAVATKYAAREDATTLGMIGSGKQAQSQFLAVAAVRDIDRAHVYSPTRQNREQYARELNEKTDVEVTAVESARQAVEGCDVVCTATTSSEPVLDGDWIDPGTHVNAIGAHYPDQREVDTRTVERSTVIVDTLDRAKKEEGELIIPAAEGQFDWDDAIEMGDIVTGQVSGRRDDEEITYMTSGGISVELLVPARDVLDRAVEEDVGSKLEFSREQPLL